MDEEHTNLEALNEPLHDAEVIPSAQEVNSRRNEAAVVLQQEVDSLEQEPGSVEAQRLRGGKFLV
jgi:hypothetical protein